MAGKIIDIRMLPMDLARLAIFPYILFHRVSYRYAGNKFHIKKGAIVVANHTSFGDPIMLASCFGYRRVQYLAGEVTMNTPIRRFFMKGLGCIKVDRTITDLNAMQECVHVLEEGRLLAMFPEGGLQTGESLKSIKSGAAYLAISAQVPIVPVYLSRKTHWYQRRTAVIGEPVCCPQDSKRTYPRKSDILQMSEQLLEKMRQCQKLCEDIQK